jgi:mycothiol synthase
VKIYMRPYIGPTNGPRMLELRRLCTTAENKNDFPTLSDLRKRLTSGVLEKMSSIALWEDAAGKVVACAILAFRSCILYFYVHPRVQGEGIETQILAWGAEQVESWSRAYDEYLFLRSSCSASDTQRIALLEQHGFVPQQTQAIRMACSLHELIPLFQLPPGFTLRHSPTRHEIEAYVEMYRETCDTVQMTVERRLADMYRPEYVPDLDLFVVEPGGNLVSFCFCLAQPKNQDDEQNEGLVAGVGTRPAFRNRGLGRAVLLAGLSGLKDYGVDTAILSLEKTNTSAQHLYTSVGFSIVSTTLWFTK